jgi:hypothetical protein
MVNAAIFQFAVRVDEYHCFPNSSLLEKSHAMIQGETLAAQNRIGPDRDFGPALPCYFRGAIGTVIGHYDETVTRLKLTRNRSQGLADDQLLIVRGHQHGDTPTTAFRHLRLGPSGQRQQNLQKDDQHGDSK